MHFWPEKMSRVTDDTCCLLILQVNASVYMIPLPHLMRAFPFYCGFNSISHSLHGHLCGREYYVPLYYPEGYLVVKVQCDFVQLVLDFNERLQSGLVQVFLLVTFVDFFSPFCHQALQVAGWGRFWLGWCHHRF